MNRERCKMRLWLSLIFVLVTLGSTAAAMAGSGGPYEVTWSTIDGGGGSSMGGGYRLEGTAGQADFGAMVGGEYRLEGGFWGGGAVGYRVYLPVVMR